MKVSLIQCRIEWLDVERNRAEAERWIAKCSGSQLVILPEMFTTGFCMEAEQCSEGDGSTLLWMQQMAQRYGCAVAGSVAVEQQGRSFNRLYVVRRDGSHVEYNKRHLFTFSGEDRVYSEGDERVIVEIDGVRVLLLICYDIRFPVWCRNRGGEYDVILCVANWAASRRRVWDLLLKARAVENLSYVCGVNIVGSDPSALYSGGSAVVDYLGEVIATVADNEQGIATCELDIEAQQRFRERFPALNDADDFEIKNK